MECRYCQAWNAEDEHRCIRCGRRLKANTARPAPDTFPITTATAPSLMGLYESVARDAGPSPEVPEPQPVGARVAYQRALFHEMQRVVELPVAVRTESPKTRRSTPRANRPRRTYEGQQSLDFQFAADAESETSIYCDAPVALPMHRLIAAFLDLSLVIVGLGLFLLTFHLAGGEIALNKQTIPFFATIAAVLAIFYHFLFCIGGGDSAGMQWTRLRLVNFDGQPPDREQRAYRLIGSLLSLTAAGLGLIWALVDEESLTWHDHISKTFPSPRD